MKVGDYVRTERFGIREIHDLRKNGKDQIIMVIIRDDQLNQIGLEMEYIKKHSPNLIDLIEDGDYVNGCYVSNKRASVNEHLGGHPKGIGIIKCNAYFNQGNYNDCKFVWIEENAIESIVTKEQFKSVEYEV